MTVPSPLFDELLKLDHPDEGQEIQIGHRSYAYHDSILRSKSMYSDDQTQTFSTYGYHWARVDHDSASETFQKQWVEEVFPGYQVFLRDWLVPGTFVLDAGCGAGHSAIAFFGDTLDSLKYIGVDGSRAIEQARDNFRSRKLEGEFLQEDLTQLPFPDGSFGMVFAPGVLHHTDNISTSVKTLARLLVSGGKFLSWVYKKQPPIREFCDRHVRQYLAPMNDDEAYSALVSLTKFGDSLGKEKIDINIPEDIPYLGIKAGTIDLQRFFYYFIFKTFYNETLGFERAVRQNFDWYRPSNAHTFSEKEAASIFQDAGLVVESKLTSMSGISIIATKP
ncbi:MAG: class I SAM-dependent methyltransferase [Proteobacteria bacterium]|nr:class I SAM-dependent methyltransferase [Pseudomonadota bacterium]